MVGTGEGQLKGPTGDCGSLPGFGASWDDVGGVAGKGAQRAGDTDDAGVWVRLGMGVEGEVRGSFDDGMEDVYGVQVLVGKGDGGEERVRVRDRKGSGDGAGGDGVGVGPTNLLRVLLLSTITLGLALGRGVSLGPTELSCIQPV